MVDSKAIQNKILANGKVDGHEIEMLRELLDADCVIDRAELEFLVELHKRVERVSPAFETFFYTAIKKHVLADGSIDAKEAAWLRRMIFTDGKVDEREKKLLRELEGEASDICVEFEALLDECT